MATAFFPVITNASKKDFDPYEDDQVPPLDLTDLAECPDQLGTVCAVHHCVRYLDEAPIVSVTTRDGDCQPHPSWRRAAQPAENCDGSLLPGLPGGGGSLVPRSRRGLIPLGIVKLPLQRRFLYGSSHAVQTPTR